MQAMCLLQEYESHWRRLFDDCSFILLVQICESMK